MAEQEPEINTVELEKAINLVITGAHKDQKLTLYSPLAAKLLIVAEESYPQFGKCTVAGHLIENVLQNASNKYYMKLWALISEKIEETSRYAPDIDERIKKVQIGAEHLDKITDVEAKLADTPSQKYITIHSPRLVAFMRYLEATQPKFKKGSLAAQLLENEVLVHLVDPEALEIAI